MWKLEVPQPPLQDSDAFAVFRNAWPCGITLGVKVREGRS